jgi:hypothetical protein
LQKSAAQGQRGIAEPKRLVGGEAVGRAPDDSNQGLGRLASFENQQIPLEVDF